MDENLRKLTADELINIVIESYTEKSTLSDENKQLKAELSALNDKITQLLEQNATLNQNLTKFIAANQLSSPIQSKKPQPSKANKRISDIFPVIPQKRTKFDDDGKPASNITSNTPSENSTTSSPTPMSISLDSSSQMSSSANNEETSAEVHTNSNENDWHFIDYKGKKDASNKKIPPVQIDVTFDGRQSLFSLLQRSIGVNRYTINQLKTKNSVRIHPANENVAVLLMNVLQGHGYKFHSYLGSDKKKQCFILRGLNGVDDTDIVHRYLIRAGLPDSTTVLRHTTGFQRANPDKNHNTLYKVIVDNSVNGDTLRNIQSISGLAVRWEKLKTDGVTQCHNCQSYFHTAACCHHEFRCVKCTDKHPPGKCGKSADNTAVPHCVNCGGAHTANNHKECKYFLDKIQPIISRRSSKRKVTDANNNSIVPTSRSNNNNNITQTKGSFASLFHTNSTANDMQKTETAHTVPANVSPPIEQLNFIDYFMKTMELMSKSISNQEKILTLLTKSKNA